jgi:hypothetical protein
MGLPPRCIVSEYNADGLLVNKEMTVEAVEEIALPKKLAGKIPEKDHAATVAQLKQAMESLGRPQFRKQQRTYLYDTQSRLMGSRVRDQQCYRASESFTHLLQLTLNTIIKFDLSV